LQFFATFYAGFCRLNSDPNAPQRLEPAEHRFDSAADPLAAEGVVKSSDTGEELAHNNVGWLMSELRRNIFRYDSTHFA
jgi:hypothetical protein